MATLQDILVSARELAFDRYPIPVFLLKKATGKAVTNNAQNFSIHPIGTTTPPTYSYTYTPNASEDTLSNLTDALIGNGYPIAFTGYFSGKDTPQSLLQVSNLSLNTYATFFRRFFLSDKKLIELVLEYYKKILRIETETTATIADAVLLLEDFGVRHLTLWLAINCVELRRLAELAASVFNMSYSDGTGATAGSNLSSPARNITVQVGSVFTLQDDNSVTSQYFQEDFNRVGSDNVLGDKESFWFKLFLWLRSKLELEFKDFQFRGDNVIVGRIDLEKDLNLFAYYDSYPYTISPLSRGILSTGRNSGQTN